ncbi:hypothetical protein BBJ28_00001168 [Nothophytophthora sp. Chile5]|nr:hypothetical protein BBJ28_00001168 [Nothophytophthora sp. Chile5]
MSGKFPLPLPPFPPLALADSERDRLEALAHRLIRKALADHDAHRQAGAKVDAGGWKLVRKCEQLAMYKRTEPSTWHQPPRARRQARPRPGSSDDDSPNQERVRQKMPMLLQVGAVRGSLDEVMYATTTVDAPAMLLKTTYTEDTLLDAETLCQLRGPSAARPFRFLGVKWIVKGTPSVARAPMVRPRDLVFVEATGILMREGSNERVGYHLMHSVSVPGYGPLDDKKIVRGQLSACTLYTEAPNAPGAVEVYMKARFEPNGAVNETVATLSASLGFMYCAKAVVCAQNKKLSWLLRSSPDAPGHHPPSKAAGMPRQRRCPICSKGFSMFSGTTNCELCFTVVCTGCFVKKKLSFAKPESKTIIQRSVAFCTSCLTHARRMDAFDIARQEVLSMIGVDGTETSTCTASTTKTLAEPLPGLPNCRRRDLHGAKETGSLSKRQSPQFSSHPSERAEPDCNQNARKRVSTWRSVEEESRRARVASHYHTSEYAVAEATEAGEMDDDGEELVIAEDALVPFNRAQRSSTYPTPSPAAGTPQEEIMARIIAMRNAAEDAYQTTRRNAEEHHEQISSARGRTINFSTGHGVYYPLVR